ncbi:hypothetical protein ACFL2Q_02900 [Thermodesulfobacteriota bacterium]
MPSGIARLLLVTGLCFTISFGLTVNALPLSLKGYQGVNLGTKKTRVIVHFARKCVTFSYDERNNVMTATLRDDDLFRHAAYRFDDRDKLVEILLRIREVIDPQQVNQLCKERLGVDYSPTLKETEKVGSQALRNFVVRLSSEGVSVH